MSCSMLDKCRNIAQCTQQSVVSQWIIPIINNDIDCIHTMNANFAVSTQHNYTHSLPNQQNHQNLPVDIYKTDLFHHVLLMVLLRTKPTAGGPNPVHSNSAETKREKV